MTLDTKLNDEKITTSSIASLAVQYLALSLKFESENDLRLAKLYKAQAALFGKAAYIQKMIETDSNIIWEDEIGE